ncbi:hypothetical protein M8C13_26465 [Crossiella sp. SN42]|uniref:hypothetical protein n=1 Tax=Crossiella sp. SN42 TaxID=2944808 RepID=UPI00207C88E5|nr:hypothetical protein [Crossiella sp. SN42]MCO1579301.1 hypothetical protein [Crossiella sp. SN42]
MNRDSESERDSQRTVADLLAQYGEGSGNAAPRRRRRRAEDANETAPQQIIDRINSDSGQMRALRDEQPPVEPPQAPPRAANVDAPSRRDLPSYDAPSYDTPSGRFARPATPTRPVPPPAPPPVSAPDAAELTTEVPAITDEYPTLAEPPAAAPSPGTATSGRLPRPDVPPVPPKPAPRAKPRVQPDPVTEVLPVIDDPQPAEDEKAQREQGEDWFTDTGYQEVYTDEGEHTAQYQAVRAPETEPEAESEDEEVRPARGPAGLDEDAEVPEDYDEDEEPRSPAKEWLMMVVQLGGGVLGGAGLWLGFQWLWRAIPSITLFLALAVIGGMVWLVRKIRKADDLQTILLAVLVGLVVTVSPAALLLVGK